MSVKLEVTDDGEFKAPFLHVTWEKPKSADTASGWMSLLYQLRIKQAKGSTWEVCVQGKGVQCNKGLKTTVLLLKNLKKKMYNWCGSRE